MAKKNKKVSISYAKSQFSFVGLVLLLYALIVLVLPTFLNTFFALSETYKPMVDNEIISIAYTYIIIVIGTIVPFSLLMAHGKIKFSDIWHKCSFSFKDIFINSIVYTAIGTMLIFLTTIISSYLNIGDGLISGIGVIRNGSSITIPLYLFLAIIVIPFVEEFAFRGVLLKVLGRYGNYFAMIATSLMYAIFHTSIGEMLPAFVLSIFLSQLTLRYRSIQPSIIVHILYNLVIHGLELIPYNLYLLSIIIPLVVYSLAIFFVVTKKYRFIRLHKRKNSAIVYSLFFTRGSIIFSIFIMLVYSTYMTFIR